MLFRSQVAISKKICNPATVNWYIHILTSCKISLIYFIPLSEPTSLFTHNIFYHILASLSLSLLSSHPLSFLYLGPLEGSTWSIGHRILCGHQHLWWSHGGSGSWWLLDLWLALLVRIMVVVVVPIVVVAVMARFVVK